MPKLTDNQHREIAFWGMAMIAMGLPLSVFLVSVGTFVLAGNWLLEGSYRKRLSQFFSNPLSLAVVSLFLLLVVGLLWTSDFSWGLKDIKVKLPLFLMPLFLFTSKLPSKKRIQDILMLFVVACMVGVLFGMARYFGLSGEELMNKRHMSVFISHIRFGLMLVIAFFILAYYLYAKWATWSPAEKILTFSVMLWLLWYIIISETFTAYAAMMAAITATAFWLILRIRNRITRISIATTIVIGAVAGSIYFKTIAENHFHEVPLDQMKLTVRTLNGNLYAHEKDVLYTENGHRVWNLVCWEELRREWPKRSQLHLDSLDRLGQPIRYTAIRYITSKGLPKDSFGIDMLSDQDILNIEKGLTNYRYTDKLGVSRRMDQLLWAYQQYKWQHNANNSSTMQRWVYTQVGWEIFKQNPLVGVGSGDIRQAYRAEYQNNDRGLEERFQGISHNQFLTIGIVLGTLGLMVFLLMLAYPAWLYRRDFLYLIFLVIMLVSFLTDNTLERQSGVTLFAFFNSLLIVRREFAET